MQRVHAIVAMVKVLHCKHGGRDPDLQNFH